MPSQIIRTQSAPVATAPSAPSGDGGTLDAFTTVDSSDPSAYTEIGTIFNQDVLNVRYDLDDEGAAVYVQTYFFVETDSGGYGVQLSLYNLTQRFGFSPAITMPGFDYRTWSIFPWTVITGLPAGSYKTPLTVDFFTATYYDAVAFVHVGTAGVQPDTDVEL